MEEIEGIPHADASDKEIKELIERLKVFKEDEFADLLHQCHNVIRNRENTTLRRPSTKSPRFCSSRLCRTRTQGQAEAEESVHC